MLSMHGIYAMLCSTFIHTLPPTPTCCEAPSRHRAPHCSLAFVARQLVWELYAESSQFVGLVELREESGVQVEASEIGARPLIGEAHGMATTCAEVTRFLRRGVAGASFWQQSQIHSTVSTTNASKAATTNMMIARTPADKEPVLLPEPISGLLPELPPVTSVSLLVLPPFMPPVLLPPPPAGHELCDAEHWEPAETL